MTMAWTMAEPYTAEMTIKADGEVITTLTESVSRDGRTYTVVTKGTNAEGQPFHNVLVFDRQ